MKDRFIMNVGQDSYNIIDTKRKSLLNQNLIIAQFTEIGLAQEYLELKNNSFFRSSKDRLLLFIEELNCIINDEIFLENNKNILPFRRFHLYEEEIIVNRFRTEIVYQERYNSDFKKRSHDQNTELIFTANFILPENNYKEKEIEIHYNNIYHNFLRHTIFAITTLTKFTDAEGNKLDVYSIQDLIKNGIKKTQ